MSRRVSPYFVAAKWNYAPAARRTANKAHACLEHAVDRLMATRGDDEWCDNPALRDALVLLEAASRQVAAWEKLQHRLAAVAQ